jgi:hypothetical protein
MSLLSRFFHWATKKKAAKESRERSNIDLTNQLIDQALMSQQRSQEASEKRERESNRRAMLNINGLMRHIGE